MTDETTASLPTYAPPPGARLGAALSGLLRMPHLAAFFDAASVEALALARPGLDGVIGWGLKPSAQRGERAAKRRGLPFWRIEDGFLRSVGLGKEGAPTVSLIVDDIGLYYDARAPSRLELLLRGGGLAPLHGRAADLIERIRRDRLTKYNHLPDRPLALARSGRRVILLADQVAGDLSIAGACASAASFAHMAETALAEAGGARVLLRRHPDVAAGKARGCLDGLARDGRFETVADDVSPHAVLDVADEVWTVSSQLGFDALLRGLPVTTFGAPFYAGYGLTRDRAEEPQALAAFARRAGAPLHLNDLAAGALLTYARYADPVLRRRIEAEEALDRLVLWRRRAQANAGTHLVYGFSRWKRPIARAYLSGPRASVTFVDGYAAPTGQGQRVCVWGGKGPDDFARRVKASGAAFMRMEDGFLRSVGLGSNFVFPASICLDRSGLYYDARQPSDLETLLASADFDAPLLARAAALRARIVTAKLTKYNLGGEPPPDLLALAAGREILLVPGQVTDDASIRFGAPGIASNEALLHAVRGHAPDACIIYKEHPDVVSGNRKGAIGSAGALADAVIGTGALLPLIAACDGLHTMTSLSGFEALLRGKPVTCWGQPFFAGWGLTTDMLPLARRQRALTLDQLVAAALILYPLYLDPRTRLFCEAEDVVALIEAARRKDADLPPLAGPQQWARRAAEYLWRQIAS